MKYIGRMVNRISNELEDAKDYAELYLEHKTKGDTSTASRYKEMATDELKHSGILHDIAAAEITRISQVYKAPTEMQEAWEASHKKYVERAAWVKMMLSM